MTPLNSACVEQGEKLRQQADKLVMLHALACHCSVSWSLTYQECSDSWACDISSACKEECYFYESTLEHCLQKCIDHLLRIAS